MHRPSINQHVHLIIPVECQIREFDAKLLLACVAARQNFPVLIGRLKTINARLSSFPRSIYLAKSIAPEFIPTFRVLHGLGHIITGWDEEALVHLPAETYFTKRMSAEAGRYVSHLFAWGRENASLWLSSPLYSGTPIHVAGNPRIDLLRPEMRPCFENAAAEYQSLYGDFFLINTNFSMVNSNRSLFIGKKGSDNVRMLGPAAYGMTREFAERLEHHKLDIFKRFQDMIPRIAKVFPDTNIIIRPHPSENPAIYYQIAADCENVYVVVKGNVIPWLCAAKAIIHNGCTTAVEASILGVPAVSYGPTSGDGHEFGSAWRLPDLLSHPSEDFEVLKDTLEKIVSGELNCFVGSERDRLLNEFVVPLEGRLCCEGILRILDEYRGNLPDLKKFRLLVGLLQAYALHWRTTATKVLKRKPRKLFEERRAEYHDFSPEHLRERLDEFQHILGSPMDLEVTKLGKYIYRIVRP